MAEQRPQSRQRQLPAVTRKTPPYFRVEYEVADVSALQAVARGAADEVQQKRALDWIIRHCCATYDVTFHPGEPDASAFAAGRRFPGQKIVELLSVSTRDLLLKEQRTKQG
jgi:hypothetical protein